jgi:hypothetical protein
MKMRDVITLAESAINWLAVPPEQMVQYVQQWGHDRDLGDGDGGSTMSAPEIAVAQARFAALVAAGPIQIYRGMVVRPASLDSGSGIGMCWTLDRRYAVPYNYEGLNHSIPTLMFTGVVEASAVDWVSTIALVNGGEQEIRLKQGARVVVTAIVDDYGASVREDLYGDIFYARGAV